jgi:ubiquitin-protein ligase
MAFNKRTLKEIAAGYNSKEFDFFHDEDGNYGDKGICYLRFTVISGIYEGQKHVLQIKFVYGKYVYPKSPPNVLFMTPIYHTNVATGGSICLDVIQEGKWSVMYGIETIFTSIVALLDDPNTSSPFNSAASRSYSDHEKKKDLEGYSKICRTHYESGMRDASVQKLINAPEFEKK